MEKESSPSQTTTLENPSYMIDIGGEALRALKIDAFNHDDSLGKALGRAIALAKAVEGERIFVVTKRRKRELVLVK